MCGVGAIYLPGDAALTEEHRAELHRLADGMVLRGPDAVGALEWGQVGMVHTRLAIIDLDPRANQPMESKDWAISYNGEIYNHTSIRRELGDRYEFRTTCDTEVLLFAIQEWGLDRALSRCAGMFAFLAYDKRDGSLYAVRDRMGIKPLFVTRRRTGEYYFASAPGALVRALPDENWREYRPAVASFFVLGAPFTTMSVIEGIERIEPGHYVRVRRDGTLRKHRYWEPRYRDEFTMEELVEVVREYEVSDVRSALFLSGGVDSTFLASTTANLEHFHLASSEAQYARAVSARYGRELVEVTPAPEGFAAGVEQVCAVHGEPFMSCGIPYVVCKAIAESGFKMAVIANGADELFHGYPRTPMPEWKPLYPQLHEDATYRWFHQQLSHIFRDSRHFRLEEYEDVVPTLLDVGFNAWRQYSLTDFPPSASYRWFELMTYVLHDLNATLDAASMANSIEVRVPFLDHRVVEGVLSWGGEELLTTEYGRKTPLKRWLSQDFPPAFFNRRKVGFSIDNKVLESVAELSEGAFRALKESGFIRINEDSGSPHLARDTVYLERSCYVYDVWRSVGPLAREWAVA